MKNNQEPENNLIIDTKKVILRTDNASESKLWFHVLEKVSSAPAAVQIMLPKMKSSAESREEKCHWFNVFMHRYFKDMKESEVLKFLFKRILQRKFDSIRKPDYIVIISFSHQKKLESEILN